MVKRVITLTAMLLIVFTYATSVLAYSTDSYSVDIPSSYTKVADGVFNGPNGVGANVQITELSTKPKGELYTTEYLDYFENEMITNFESSLQGITAEDLKKFEEMGYTKEDIDYLLSNTKVKKIHKKEITTVSKNNYECFHIIGLYSMAGYEYYTDQYQVYSDGKFFTLTINGENLSDLNSTQAQKIIDSFTIKNFKPYSPASSFWEEVGPKALGSMIAVALFSIPYYLKNKKSKDKKFESIAKTETKIAPEEHSEIENAPLLIKEESVPKKVVIKPKVVVKPSCQVLYCRKCGTRLLEGSDFCHKCGAQVIKE